jgi:predicted PurR-regulated permease PerM
VKPESRYWLIIVALAGFFWLLYLLAPVITPFAAAAALAYLGDPLVDRVEKMRVFRWNISRSLAVTVVFSLIFLTLLAVLLLLIPLLIEQFKYLVNRIPEWIAWLLGTALPWVLVQIGMQPADFGVEEIKTSLTTYWKEFSSALLGMMGTVSAGGQAVLNGVMNLVLIPVVTFYLMRDWDELVEGCRTLVPHSIEPTVSRLAREIDGVLGAFIRGQLMVMLALGLVYTGGLWLLGLDLAFIIGMGAGLLSIVPYLGTFVGVLAALIAALVQFQDVLHPLMALAVFAVGQSLESMVLTPKLVGDKVGLHAVAVIFAVLAGGHLFGFLGILMALPVASALNVLVRYAHLRYRGSAWFKPLPNAETDGPGASGSRVKSVGAAVADPELPAPAEKSPEGAN